MPNIKICKPDAFSTQLWSTICNHWTTHNNKAFEAALEIDSLVSVGVEEIQNATIEQIHECNRNNKTKQGQMHH